VSGLNVTSQFYLAVSISYTMGTFPLQDDVCDIYLMFLFSVFMWPCDLDLCTFDLDDHSYTKFYISNAHTNFYHPRIIRSWVKDDWICSHFHYT